MSIKKISTFLLIIIMTISFVLSACGDDNTSVTDLDTSINEIQENIGETETVGLPEPELPNVTYDGSDFTFMIRSRDSYAYEEIYVYTETMDGEVVNDAIFERNSKVEERFDINIKIMEFEDDYATATKMILAGDDSFDVMYDRKFALGKLAYEGLLIDLKTLDYIDFHAPYWESNAYEQLQVAGKLYMIPSDISMQNLSGARLLYFNKFILDNHNLTTPYEFVKNDNWTLDNFIKLVESVSQDLNGDGIMDKEDLFGMLTETGANNGNILYFTVGTGVRMIDSKPDGIELAYMSERTQSVIDKVRDVLLNPNLCIEYNDVTKGVDTSGFAHLYTYARQVLFAGDHFLFVQNGISSTSEFINMESDYGIAPNPKLDENQENYYHKLDIYNTILSIPVTNQRLDMTAMILEYMAYQSNQIVVPAYYETTIKTKRFRDNEAENVLEIIKNSLYYDISDIYFSMLSTPPTSVIYNAFVSGNLTSEYEKSAISLQKKLDDIYEKINSNP